MIIYYDTNVLLELQDRMFDLGYFHISNITIDELESIKTSGTKDEETKYKARFNEYRGKKLPPKVQEAYDRIDNKKLTYDT